MIDYKLDDSGWSEFERLIQTVVKGGWALELKLGEGVATGVVTHTLRENSATPVKRKQMARSCFNASYVENANAAGAKPEKPLAGAVQKECAKIRRNLKSGKWKEAPNCYGFFTNAPCTATLRESLRASLRKVLPGAHISIHDGGDICRWLSPEIVRSFPRLHAPPKAISALHQLPAAPAAFTGREEELSDLAAALAKKGNIGVAISALKRYQGMGGVGKTALATVSAHRLKDKYPDAQICLNLRGFDQTDRKPMPPAEAMQGIIHVFQPKSNCRKRLKNCHPSTTPCSTKRRVLLFLTTPPTPKQIQPLLPPSNCRPLGHIPQSILVTRTGDAKH